MTKTMNENRKNDIASGSSIADELVRLTEAYDERYGPKTASSTSKSDHDIKARYTSSSSSSSTRESHTCAASTAGGPVQGSPAPARSVSETKTGSNSTKLSTSTKHGSCEPITCEPIIRLMGSRVNRNSGTFSPNGVSSLNTNEKNQIQQEKSSENESPAADLLKFLRGEDLHTAQLESFDDQNSNTEDGQHNTKLLEKELSQLIKDMDAGPCRMNKSGESLVDHLTAKKQHLTAKNLKQRSLVAEVAYGLQREKDLQREKGTQRENGIQLENEKELENEREERHNNNLEDENGLKGSKTAEKQSTEVLKSFQKFYHDKNRSPSPVRRASNTSTSSAQLNKSNTCLSPKRPSATSQGSPKRPSTTSQGSIGATLTGKTSEAQKTNSTKSQQTGRQSQHDAKTQQTRQSQQLRAFGNKDRTGVESVHDVMPSERNLLFRALHDIVKVKKYVPHPTGYARPTADKTLRILDFGCGDGRYLSAFVLMADLLLLGMLDAKLCSPCTAPFHEMLVVFVDVSKGALEELKDRIRKLEAEPVLKMKFLRFEFVVTDCLDEPDTVAWKIQNKINEKSGNYKDKNNVVVKSDDVQTEEHANSDKNNDKVSLNHEKPFHLAVCGWGVLSCIPELVKRDLTVSQTGISQTGATNSGTTAGAETNPQSSETHDPNFDPWIIKPRQFAFLKMLADLSWSLINVTSSKNNFMKEQARFNAMRQARDEVLEKINLNSSNSSSAENSSSKNQNSSTSIFPKAQLLHLEKKLGLTAHTPDSFYYGKHKMFYAAVDYDEELYRTKLAGFDTVDISICNIVNFFDILSDTKKEKLNRILTSLCEEEDGDDEQDKNKKAEKCRQFLSKGVGFLKQRTYRKEDMKNPVFRSNKPERINQVARYFLVYAHNFPDVEKLKYGL